MQEIVYTTVKFWGGWVSWAGLGGWAGSWVREFGRPVGWAGPRWAGQLGWVALVRGFVGRSRVRVGELSRERLAKDSRLVG